jgi:hypothetical protein
MENSNEQPVELVNLMELDGVEILKFLNNGVTVSSSSFDTSVGRYQVDFLYSTHPTEKHMKLIFTPLVYQANNPISNYVHGGFSTTVELDPDKYCLNGFGSGRRIFEFNQDLPSSVTVGAESVTRKILKEIGQ